MGYLTEPIQAQPPWSGTRAVAVTLVPILLTVSAVWAELGWGHGTSVWSFVAGALYFSSPTVGAVAASRTLAPINVLRIVALAIAAILVWDVLTFAPRPTQAGLYVGGLFMGILLPIGGALAWYFPSLIALGLVRRGVLWLGFIVSALLVPALSFVAVVIAFSI